MSVFANHFSRQNSIIPFNNAGLSMNPERTLKKAQELFEHSARSAFSDMAFVAQEYAEARKTFARFLNCDPNCLSFSSSCAVSISQIALGMKLNPGDQILSWDMEYPSNAYPWIEAARRSGAEFCSIATEKTPEQSVEKLCSAINHKTKVVTFSWFQFLNGLETPLAPVVEASKKVGAKVVVDAIQGLGIVPFDFQSSGVDAVCGGAHKWMCGPLGLGFFAAKEEFFFNLKPLYVGAQTYTDFLELKTDPGREPHRDPRRFEPGAPFFFLANTAAESVKLLNEVGVDEINRSALELSSYLREELLKRDFRILSPEKSRSPVITVKAPGSVELLSQKLQERRILHALRMGGIRLSPHAYCSKEDVEQLLELA